MTGIELLQSSAVTVLRDVDATTNLHVALSDWADPENGIGAVVHEAGVQPTKPVWEAAGFQNGGDCVAIHAPMPPDGIIPGIAGRADVTVMVADAAQDVVQILLWAHGIHPAWPACAEHRGRHPLRARCNSDAPVLGGDASTVADSVARWECPTGTTSIPIGHLKRFQI
ncbi:hypothetical protein [Terracoccus sp. 273MFTsu3.1]|uniref:hypothetical protein n=1 Tax=Terracoccus sp. 273MFTsu3.1 TaxID=1172188 RepID=UPI000375FF0B|nr:hypothetical protein [Terracoccus sp. 273MFTsu3.1]